MDWMYAIMKWSAFPTSAMAFDPQISSDLDEERDLTWQIDEYFAYPKEEGGPMSPRLCQVVGKGVTLPIFKISDEYLKSDQSGQTVSGQRKDTDNPQRTSECGDRFEFQCLSLSASHTKRLVGDVMTMRTLYLTNIKSPLSLCRIFHGIISLSFSLSLSLSLSRTHTHTHTPISDPL